ncbi:hypothetical protein Trydic_g9352 [Trypoxylus dichotomus]
MKSFLVLTACVALASASVDPPNIKPRDVDLSSVLRLPRIPASGWDNSQRVVGGNEVAEHSKPYQVALLLSSSQGTFFCGGSLISRKSVLTAAHCVDGVNSAEVILGAHRFAQNEESQVRVQVSSSNFKIHSGWNSLLLTNDIAIIELNEEVELNDFIQVVSLPSRSEVSNTFTNNRAIVSGWGLDSDSAITVSSVLREVEVRVLAKLVCNLAYFGIIQNSHICTSGIGGVGSCSGDSGGPLVIGDKQIGVVSFGIAFGCEIGWPSVFTRVTSYLDWIEDNSDVVIS